MDEKSNIKIPRVPTKEGLEETLKLFNLKMQEASVTRAAFFPPVEPWSPFQKISRDDVQNGKN